MTQNNSIPVPPKPDQKSNIPVPPSPNLERSDISQTSIEPQQAKEPAIVLDESQSFVADHRNKIQDFKIKMIENKKPLVIIGGIFVLLLALALGGYLVYQGSNNGDNKTIGSKVGFNRKSEDFDEESLSGRSGIREYTNERGTWEQVGDNNIEFEGKNEKWDIVGGILEYEGYGHKWGQVGADNIDYEGIDGIWSKVGGIREYTDPEGRHYDVVGDIKEFNIDGESYEQVGDIKEYNADGVHVSEVGEGIIDHQTDDTSYHQVGDIKEIDE